MFFAKPLALWSTACSEQRLVCPRINGDQQKTFHGQSSEDVCGEVNTFFLFSPFLAHVDSFDGANVSVIEKGVAEQVGKLLTRNEHPDSGPCTLAAHKLSCCPADFEY